MKTHFLRALSESAFLYLWIGEVFTQISVNLFNFFLILVVFEKTHSNTAVSGVVISFTIPAIIFGSVAGAYVDHWNKRTVLILTNISRALLLVILALCNINIYLLYLISFVFASLTQFFIPAETPMIPLVVKEHNLLSANALFSMGIYGSILIAYVLSGPLLLLIGQVNTLLILALLLFIGAAFISLIKFANVKKKKLVNKEEEVNIFKDLRATLGMMSQTKAVSNSLFLLALSQILILIIATIAPGYASSVLKIHVEEFPLLFVAPAALGMVVGAVLLVNRFHSHSKSRIITTGLIICAIALMLLPFGSKVTSRDFVHTINTFLPHVLSISILHIMVVIAFCLGIGNSLVFVQANTLLQEKTSDETRGKIYGFLNTLVGALSFLPIIIVGGLSDIVGVSAVLVGIGILLFIIAITRIFVE